MSNKVFCKYCGISDQNVSSLTMKTCPKHPDSPNKAKHALYEGSEKTSYTCKYCGTKASTISGLTINRCLRSPKGTGKGFHEPAL